MLYYQAIMTKILAIDTSTDACSVALLANNEVADFFEIAPQRHTHIIFNMIKELLNSAQLELTQLDALAFGYGPGSFTGVRLAASIIQGLAFAANLPVVKVSTLRALAQESYTEFGAKQILVAQDARMNEIYLGQYQVGNDGIMHPIKPDCLIKPEELSSFIQDNFVGVGNAFEVFKDFWSGNIEVMPKQYVQAKSALKSASFDFAQGLTVKAEDALPIYIRDKIVQSF